MTEIYRRTGRAALVGLAFNLTLGLIKLICGLIAGAFALVADSINSLGDSVSSIVVLLALKISQRPADTEHPYGHSRAEGVAASSVALLIMVSALLVATSAIQRLSETHGVPPAWALWIAAANVLIKEGLYHYNVRVGRSSGSAALIASAWDHRSDAFCSAAVLVGLGVVYWGGSDYAYADDLAALLIAAVILIGGGRLFRSSVVSLLDPQAEPERLDAVRAVATGVDGVCAVEKIFMRRSGLEHFVDIHVQVHPQRSVAEGHAIGHAVKDALLARFPNVRDVLVHLEPVADPDAARARCVGECAQCDGASNGDRGEERSLTI